MSTIHLRLPDSLHETPRDLAAKEPVPIDLFIALAVAEKISALATEDYLGTRAQCGDREKFVRAMAKVPDVGPEQCDCL